MMLTTSNDKEIIEFIKDNQEYFFRVAFSYVKNQDQALDIVQEAIVKALQKRYTLRHIEYLKTWFYRILVNECFATIKKSKKLLFLGSYQDFEESLKTKDKYHEEDELYHAMDLLEPKLKMIIILRFFEDMKIEEIAKITRTNTNTVKTRLYKALKILKMNMEEFVWVIKKKKLKFPSN